MRADSLDECLRTLAEVKRKRLRLDPRERSSRITLAFTRSRKSFQVLLERLLTGPQELHRELARYANLADFKYSRLGRSEFNDISSMPAPVHAQE
jgi:hypothetical protein